jgi:hypothetical protein
MLEKRFCGYKKDGSQLLLSDADIIQNALEQEKDGVKPRYAFYDWKNKKRLRLRAGLYGRYGMAAAV